MLHSFVQEPHHRLPNIQVTAQANMDLHLVLLLLLLLLLVAPLLLLLPLRHHRIALIPGALAQLARPVADVFPVHLLQAFCKVITL